MKRPKDLETQTTQETQLVTEKNLKGLKKPKKNEVVNDIFNTVSEDSDIKLINRTLFKAKRKTSMDNIESPKMKPKRDMSPSMPELL